MHMAEKNIAKEGIKTVQNITKKIKLPKLGKKGIIALSVILGLVVIALLIRFFFIAAIVNGKPIGRIEVLSVAEKQGGKTILDSLIDQDLVLQEAKNLKINITKAQIDTEVKNIETTLTAQNITLVDALAMSNQTLEELNEQVKVQLIVESILGPKITITDQEVSDYYTTNKAYFAANAKLADLKPQIQDAIYKQKLTTEYTTWIADLKTKAKILYFVNYK
jgi:foldase protein PrsA